LKGTLSHRGLPSPWTDKREDTTEEDSVWRNCYDPYEQGDDDDDGETDDNESDNWIGNEGRIVTSQGTEATFATGKTDETLRQSKTNFEVLYDIPHGYPYKTSKTSSYRSLTKLNCLKQSQQLQDHNYVNVSCATRPKGVASLAEF
jgi:hypothetical protein